MTAVHTVISYLALIWLLFGSYLAFILKLLMYFVKNILKKILRENLNVVIVGPSYILSLTLEKNPPLGIRVNNNTMII